MIKRVLFLSSLFMIGLDLHAKVIVVDTSGATGFKTIQAGVAAADSGDTVFVKKGIYYADETYLKKPIFLLSENMDSTLLFNTRDSREIVVQAEGCTISGFTIGGNWAIGCSGIQCDSTSPAIIYNTFSGGYSVSRKGISFIQENGSFESSAPGFVGIDCRGPAAPVINYNNFYSGMAISTFLDSMNINAKYNYWNATDSAGIKRKISDETPGVGIVDFVPWLVKPVVAVSENRIRPQSPEYIRLNQNWPNPFRATTSISYQLTANKSVMVILKLYDITGKEIRTLVNAIQKPGDYSIAWDGLNNKGEEVPKGIYYYMLTIDGCSMSRKAVFIK